MLLFCSVVPRLSVRIVSLALFRHLYPFVILLLRLLARAGDAARHVSTNGELLRASIGVVSCLILYLHVRFRLFNILNLKNMDD